MNTNFRPAPGCIVIIPQFEDNRMGDMVIADYQSLMPIGKVVACGKLPLGFPRLRPGDTIAYQRGQYIEMSVLIDGVTTKVTVIYGPDFRGKFMLNEKTNRFSGIATAFAVGAAAGWISGQFITAKDLIRKFAHGNRAIQFLVQIFSHTSRKRD